MDPLLKKCIIQKRNRLNQPASLQELAKRKVVNLAHYPSGSVESHLLKLLGIQQKSYNPNFLKDLVYDYIPEVQVQVSEDTDWCFSNPLYRYESLNSLYIRIFYKYINDNRNSVSLIDAYTKYKDLDDHLIDHIE